MDRLQDDRNERLRSILKRMERSIDDARSRRVTNGEELVGEDVEIGRNATPNGTSGPAFDPLDTQIADSTPADAPAKPGPVRDQDTMFDFDGPRLKARPKRRTAG